MIYLQKYDRGESGYHLGREEQLIYSHLVVEGKQCRFFNEHNLDELTFKDAELVVGSIQSVGVALEKMGRQLPAPNYYPDILTDYLERKVWVTDTTGLTLCQWPVFVKPTDWKSFDGRVVSSSNDLKDIPTQKLLHVSDVVTFIAEYRVYVVNGEIVEVSRYDSSDNEAALDKRRVGVAVQLLKLDPESPTSFAIDFGVTDDGRTLLVELNDGFSIGAYGKLKAKDYYDLLKSRWNEMLK
ncbi:ATP-grasp domain-containing protein [Vibrio alginolyticus]|uniref:ATP-grasp domain-containing protein n=1 Tax=Vibrio alginolyticus TaxID=663 RepID=UPI0006CA90DF|nr:ATP-grasp domain-containing protein [Vibrio alginolyticus]CAH7167061.1 putative R2K_2 domain-containing protein [Vibrio chagasii]